MFVFALVACVDAPRQPLQFPVGVDGGAPEVVLDAGTATLDVATVHLSDIRFEGAPVVARWSWSPFPAAYAHPGHDFAGDVRAELLGDWEVDLLAEHTELGIADAYEGDLATARFQFVGDPSVRLEGTWHGDGAPLTFAFDLALDDLVSGLTLDADLSADAPPPGFTLTFDFPHALSFVEWTDENGDGALTPADGTTANTVEFGVASSASWAFGLTSESP